MKCIGFLMAIVFMVGVNGDKEVEVGNITTQVKGQSGKILIYAGENETNGVTVTFDALKEIDTEGNPIMGGPNKHVYMTFASLDFNFSDTETSKYQGVNVTQFSFTATIKIDEENNLTATLTSYVYIFGESGIISAGGKNVSVKSGDVKFNVKIENWPFCGSSGVTCSQGQSAKTGEFLDFYIEIKGKKEAAANNSDRDHYELGEGAKLVVPNQVIYDGNTTDPQDMPTGYPKLEVKNAKQTFVFRFKTFASSALYDPVVQLQQDDGTDGGDNEGTVTDKQIGASGISAKVNGQSGKINIMSTSSTGDSGGNRLTVEFDNLKEVTEAGADSKIRGHTFNNFANQKFSFSNVTDDTYMNLAVQRVTFMTTLSNRALLKVHLLAFKAAGNFTNDDETIMVESGNIKFNVEISNWSFCTGAITECKNEVGQYLDFEIVTKGSKKASMAKSEEKMGAKYNLGSGSIVVSKKVKIDGAWVNMTDGYPKYETRGSRDIFKFRYNKFTTSVMYDPVLSLAAEENVSTAVKSSFMMTCVVVVCAIISGRF